MAEEKTTAEEKKEGIVNSDLRILIEGSERKLLIKDKNGTEHRLNPLDLSDIIEFEDTIGTSLLDIASAKLKMQHITFLLYLSLRKENCTLEDIEKRNWKHSQRQVETMFDLKFLFNSVAVFSDLLSVSGFKLGVANPPQSQPK